MTEKARGLLKSGGIMTLAILILASLIILAIKLTEGTRVRKLKESVQGVIGDEWQIGDELSIPSLNCTNSSAFALTNGEENAVAVVMRVETIYGPMPSVYVCEYLDEAAIYMGSITINGRIAKLLKEREAQGRQSINYWALRIPSILRAADDYSLNLEDLEENSAK